MGAYKQLKAMMARNERLSIYFSIDQYGFEIARIESKTVAPFNFQLNQESFDWLMVYLIQGKTDKDVDPTQLKKSEEKDRDLFRANLMKAFIDANLGQFQFVPAFLDRPGRLTATAKFKNGTIKFFTVRDESTEQFLHEHSIVA